MPMKPDDYKLKLALGIPFSGRYVPPEWAIALATLTWPLNIMHAIVHVKGQPRENARDEIVNLARFHRAEYIGMLDDDVEIPRDSINQLIATLDQRPDFDIIAAIVPRRSVCPEPMVYQRAAGGAYWRWKIGDIFEIAEASTGCMIIRSSLFDRLTKPWFKDLGTLAECIEAGTTTAAEAASGEIVNGSMSDDIYFCRKAVQAGARLLGHGGVICKHWGRKNDCYELAKDSYPYQPAAGPIAVPASAVSEPERVDSYDPRIQSALTIHGWMSPVELLWLAEQAERSTNMLEIGSWCGRSARALAENSKGHLTCVDTWAADSDRATAPQFAKGLAEHDGNPDWTWDEFRFNMLGLNNVGAIRLPSIEAIKQVPPEMTFDFIFIDGAHDYANVKADIETWLPKLAPGGVIAGHDYDYGWRDVVRAVDELLPETKHVESIWYTTVDSVGS